jgi:hypothetical protein
MSALISSIEHSLAVAASDTVKAAKFVETSVLPVLKKAQADQATIESITSLVSPTRPTSSARVRGPSTPLTRPERRLVPMAST